MATDPGASLQLRYNFSGSESIPIAGGQALLALAVNKCRDGVDRVKVDRRHFFVADLDGKGFLKKHYYFENAGWKVR